ncbi:MAG: TlpA family protein disulfide reductase [Phycisphaerales bacterium]|nr:TlpA family protein disulfide reductase [Phycisphaerales bacterium]
MRLAAIVLSCALSGLGLSSVGMGALDDSSIPLRGGGKTRENLNALQLKPFDFGVLGGVSGWTGGDAPTPEAAKGKVVLIVTWAGWYRPSQQAVRQAQEALAKFKDKGLLVVAVHSAKGAEGAAESAKGLGIGFPWGVDTEGKFRAALKCEQDPNVYFVDRSGNLRFAQTDVSAIMSAAELLVNETPEQAKDLPSKLAAQKAQAERERWRTRENTGNAPGEYPEVEFKAPDEDAYKPVKWPYLVGKVEKDKILEKITLTPPTMSMSEENWAPSKPKTAGKIVVLYVFDPQEQDTLNVIEPMNQLQDKYKRDVVVVGQAAKFGTTLLNPPEEEAKKLTERNTGLLKTLMTIRGVNHFMQPSPFKGEQWDFLGGNSIPLYGRSQREIGLAMVISTDNKVRWLDDPYSSSLAVAIEKMIDVDPGVQARRKAEDAARKGK